MESTLNDSYREPGEIEIWKDRTQEWVPNSFPCYVTENMLCASKGCNRRLRNKKSRRKHLDGSPRYCSAKCVMKNRKKAKKNGQR